VEADDDEIAENMGKLFEKQIWANEQNVL
jgi:hypothetical protein